MLMVSCLLAILANLLIQDCKSRTHTLSDALIVLNGCF